MMPVFHILYGVGSTIMVVCGKVVGETTEAKRVALNNGFIKWVMDMDLYMTRCYNGVQ
jgi:hypothetical protein